MTEVFNLLGTTEESFKEAKAEPSTGGSFIWSSNAYKVEIAEAVVFNVQPSNATMFKLVIKDTEEDKTLTEYFNTSYLAKKDDKDGKFKVGDRVENKSGTKIFKSLLSALHLEPTALTITDTKIIAYAKENVDAKSLGLEGRGFIALVREVDDTANNDKYGSFNTIEAAADIEGKIDGSTEPLNKWKVKIEKAPVLVKKAKKGGAKQAVASEASKKAAKKILDI